MEGITGRIIVGTISGEAHTFQVCFDDRALVLYSMIESATGFRMKVRKNENP